MNDGTLPCVEIIIREGNFIYIPYGWYYTFYKGQPDTVIMTATNKTLLGYRLKNHNNFKTNTSYKNKRLITEKCY
jgi:hypothetical protein